MEITGTIKRILPTVTGQGKNGTWIKQPFVITTEGQYPKEVYIEAFGKVSEVVNKLKVNQKVKVSFNLESREYNERYYTSIQAWKVEDLNESSTSPKSESDLSSENIEDDLPF